MGSAGHTLRQGAARGVPWWRTIPVTASLLIGAFSFAFTLLVAALEARPLLAALQEALALALLVATAASLLLVRLSRRLCAMRDVIEQFSAGDSNARVLESRSTNELESTVSGLNRMMETVVFGMQARSRAEMSLRQGEERFRRIFDEAATGLLLVDSQGKITRVNRAFARLLGREAGDLLGQSLESFAAEGLSDSESLLMLDLKAGRVESAHMERRLRHRQGRIVWAEMSIAPLADQDDAGTLIYQVQDTTSRRDAQRALDETLELNQKIIDSASPAILAFRSNGACIFASENAARIFRESTSLLLGRNFRSWPPWTDAGLVREAEWVLSRGGSRRFSAELNLAGQRLDLDCVLSTFQRNGETHLLVMAEDATARRRAEFALLDAEKQATIGQLSAGVAHEFNNILAILQTQLQLLRNRPELSTDPAITSTLSTLAEQITRGGAIVRGLMTLARPRSAQKVMRDAADIARDVLVLQRHQLETESISLSTDLAPDLLVETDSSQIHQVLLTLILRARNAMAQRQSGRLGIRVAHSGKEALFEVADNGGVIGPLPQVFEDGPLSAASERSSAEPGLAMCQRVVTAHGGRLYLRSGGDGSTVSFTLPLTSADTRARHPESADPIPSESLAAAARSATPVLERILIVDDEESLATGLALFLRQHGYIVDCYTKAIEAERAMASSDYAAALLDQMMPGRSGLDLARMLRARNPEIAIFLMTGMLDPDTLSTEAKDVSMISILHKPFDLADLANKVEGALGTRRRA